MPSLIYGSSQTNPNYANYRGSTPLVPQSSQTNPYAANYQNRIQVLNSVGLPAPTTAGAGSVLGAKTGGTGAQAPVQSTPQNNYNPVQSQLNDANSQIDSDYNNYINDLNSQQGYLQSTGEAQIAGSQNQAEQVKTQFGQEKNTKLAGLATQEQTANTQATSAMQQARDLYRQAQQQNVASLSGLGISSSSVAEALAERLGVETARRIAGVTGSQQEILQNVAKERANTENYYAQRTTQLEQSLKAQTDSIRSQLVQGLDTINRARNVASSERANMRQQALTQAQTAVYQLQQQAQQFAQALTAWKEQNTTKFADIGAQIPQMLQGLQTAASGMGQISQFGGLQFTPQVSIGQGGKVTGSVTGKKPNEILDPFATPQF